MKMEDELVRYDNDICTSPWLSFNGLAVNVSRVHCVPIQLHRIMEVAYNDIKQRCNTGDPM